MDTVTAPAPATPALRRYRLQLEPATAEALAPFGEIVGPQANAPTKALNFYNGIISKPANFISDEQTQLSVVTLKRRPFEVLYIERHWKHTQTFMPLGAKPFIAVMAPPSDGELPPLEALRAFLFDGTAGFCMKVGCWHEFPFVLLDDTTICVILRRETVTDLTQVVNGEAFGADLDKKNLQAREGVVVEIAL